MFDSTATIEVTARGPQGLTTLVLRWPTDEEWIQRARSRRFIIKRLGRGQSETTIESGDFDQKLYEKIRTNGGPDLTSTEAARVIDAIAACEVTDVEIDGPEAIVSLEVVSGPVKHKLRLPTADEVLNFRRGAYRLLELPYNKQELRINLEACARLWDACGGSSNGTDYTGPVPALHKDVAIRAVIDHLDREVAVKRDEENF